MKKWYTLHTKPNSEYRVAGALQQREIEVYLPEMYEKPKRMPFFPCYLFMKVDLERIAPLQWQWTPGLRGIISFDGQPASLPDEIINGLRHKVDEIESNGRALPDLRPGDIVRIKEGPLRGMLAIFDGPTMPSQRVQVLLTMLGRASRVRIDAAGLEKVLPETQVIPVKRSRRTRGNGRRVRQKTS